MGNAPHLWARQPWDSDASFARFHEYYLPQESPRSLNEAYRRYLADRRGPDKGQTKAREKEAPGGWRRWFRGQNGKGQPIPDAKTWEQRAAAYDDYLAEIDRAKWEQRHRDLREQDWQAGADLRALAGQILEQTPQFLTTKRRLIRGKDGAPDQLVTTVELDGAFMLKVIDLASKLQHQATEITPAQKHEHSGPGGGPIQSEVSEVHLYLPQNGRESNNDGDACFSKTDGSTT